MVMGQFVTTYRKDYLWPYVKTLGFRPEPEKLYQPQYRNLDDCQCHQIPTGPRTNTQKLNIVGPQALNDEQWSRLGPMGPLLEPKVISARVAAAPESDIPRFNQPNTFMRKLQEKYPFIYECLKTAPPDDLIARINKDRLSTTYQVEYCNKREYPSAPYDELIRAAGVEGLSPCPEPVRLPGDVCRPTQKVKAHRDGTFSKTLSQGSVIQSKREDTPLGSCRGGIFSVTPGATEYMDTVSRLGTLIIRDRLHERSRKLSSMKNKP